MSSQLKMLRRIQKARERMRDAAAAEVAIAEQKRSAKQEEKEILHRLREELIVSSRQQMREVTGVSQLERLAMDIGGADLGIVEAGKQVELAGEATLEAVTVLRERERAVRLSEELVARKKQVLQRSADKEEQAMVDDMIAGRRKEE